MLVLLGSSTTLAWLGGALTAWSDALLLGDVVTVPVDPEGQLTRLHEGTTSNPSGLHEALAGVAPTDVKVVVLVPGPEFTQTSLLHDVDQVVDSLRDILPAQHPPVPSLLAVPHQPDDRLDPDWFGHPMLRWFVLAAEDRRDGSSNNTLAGDDDHLARHAAHAAICLAGEWSFSAESCPLDEPDADPGGNSARIVRCHSRIIDLGHLADHVAADVLQPGMQWPNPDVERFEVRTLTEARGHRVADAYMAQHDGILGLTPYTDERHEPARLTLWEAIVAVFRHIVSRLRRLPMDWLDKTIGMAYDSVAERIEQHDQGAGVRIRRWRDVRTQADEVVHELGSLELDPDLVEQGAVGPAWADMHRLAFGLCDGTPLPESIVGDMFEVGGRRLVETNPRQLVPDPKQLPPGGRGHAADSIRACDPLAHDPAVAAEDSDDDTSVSTTSPVVDLEWLRPRRESLLWMIGVQIARNLRQARHEAVSPSPDEWRAILEDARQAPEKVARARRRFWLWLLFRTVLAIVASVLPVLRDDPLWVQLGLPLVAWLVWLLTLGRGWQRAERTREEVEGAIRRRSEDWLNRAGRAIVRAADAQRLGNRYREYLDWAEIAGWYLHHPFVPGAGGTDPSVEPLPPGTTPTAMSVGLGVIDRGGLLALAQNVRGKLFHESWLQTYHASVRAQHIELWRRRVNVPAEEVAGRTGYRDTTHASTSLRRHLVAEARRGTGRAFDDNPLSTSMLAVLEGQPVEVLAEQVVPLGQDGLWRGPLAAWSEDGRLKPEAISALRASVVRLRCTTESVSSGATGVVVRSSGVLATNQHVVDGTTQIQAEIPAHGWVDARVIAVSHDTDLALLALDGVDDLRASELGDARSLTPASRVYTMGFVHLMDGEPSLAEGMVTSAERYVPHRGQDMEVVQASYPASGGASGSPVCDSSGRLVGIHQGGAEPRDDGRDPGTISFFVPVRNLRELLAVAGHELPESTPPTVTALPRDGVSAGNFLHIVHHGDEEIDRDHIADPLFRADGRRVAPLGSSEEPQRRIVFHRPGRIGVAQVHATAPVDVTHLVATTDDVTANPQPESDLDDLV